MIWGIIDSEERANAKARGRRFWVRGDLKIVHWTIFAKARSTPRGFSTLGKWLSQYGGQSQSAFDTQIELKRLRRELKIALEERDVLKKATEFFARAKR